MPFGSTDVDRHHHGHGADNAWHVTSEAAGAIELAIDYPQGHPVARLERRIRGMAGRTAIDLELTVVTRKDCLLPVGLHPIFRLPDAGKRMRFSVTGSRAAIRFPACSSPACRALQRAGNSVRLDAVPLAGGGSADLSQPPADLREEIVLLEGANGGVSLGYPDEGFTVRLEWNRRDFPALVMWLSDRGRSTPPWSSLFQGIGIEPVNGFFDNTALAGHASAGLALGRRFRAGERWTTHYRISASRIDAGQTRENAR